MFEAKVTQTIGREMAAWQTSSDNVSTSRKKSRRRSLTARVWLDLPVHGEWPTRRENGDDTRNEASDDEDESEIGRVAVTFPKAILLELVFNHGE